MPISIFIPISFPQSSLSSFGFYKRKARKKKYKDDEGIRIVDSDRKRNKHVDKKYRRKVSKEKEPACIPVLPSKISERI